VADVTVIIHVPHIFYIISVVKAV